MNQRGREDGDGKQEIGNGELRIQVQILTDLFCMMLSRSGGIPVLKRGSRYFQSPIPGPFVPQTF